MQSGNSRGFVHYLAEIGMRCAKLCQNHRPWTVSWVRLCSLWASCHNKQYDRGEQAPMSSPEAHSPNGSGTSRTSPEDLQRRIATLEEAVAARDTFIAVASHELRNPMTPMIGQVELLLSGLRTGRYSHEQVEQRLERIRQVMNHYLKRTAILLDVSRITSGKFKLEPTSFNLSDLV